MTDPVVREHLLHVVRTLRRAAPATPEAAEARADALDALEAYARAGRFPRPDGPVGSPARRVTPPRAFAGPDARAPLFRDSAGTWCAVGHLLARDAPEAAASIAATRNGHWLLEIDAPALGPWARARGFTPEELAWIQPAYCWELPACDEVVWEAPDAPVTAAEGPDAGVAAVSYCQVCDGPFTVQVWVENAGTVDVTGVTVTLGTHAFGPLQTVTDVAIPAGAVVALDAFQLGEVSDVAGYGYVQTTLDGDAYTDNDLQDSWAVGLASSGRQPPAACTDGCGCEASEYECAPADTAPEDTGDTSADPPACGCATGAPLSSLALGAWLVGASLARRRPRLRAST